jgi:excinuclease ABC subunit C
MEADELRERASALPREPGVYQFVEGETVQYVGKAVDLRDRVRSYTDPRSQRVARMVDRADDVDFAVTDTETQALLLEANLIKRQSPRFNVRLKDDKSYPLVQLTDHPIPRIEVTRDPAEGATVFGPFTSVARVETVVKALRETYGLRGCSDHKYESRDRPCLDYEVGLCSAPCVDEIDAKSYREDVTAVRRFFEGETGVLVDPLERAMESAAANREFERAGNLRDRLEVVRAFHGDSEAAISAGASENGRAGDDARAGDGEAGVDGETGADGEAGANGETGADSEAGYESTVDVLGATVEGDSAVVARLHSENGQLVDRSRHTLDAPEGSDGVAAVLSAFLVQYYAERSFPDAVLLSERPAERDVRDWLESEGVAVRVPGVGREAKLVDLALKNARTGPTRTDELTALGDAVGIARPERIEGFDVSHAQGRDAVGSNVCFVDGSAEKSDYRRKKLTDQNDDYDNMHELVRWRAQRSVEGRDDRPDPDLLVIDGGDSQLGAARDALSVTGWDVPAVALAKEEELVVTERGVRDWDDDAPQLHVLQRVRDEAHRFAVQYHQTLRDDVSTVLEAVPGVGPETRQRLLRRFGSVENVRAASYDDLTDVPGVGDATAETILRRL